MTVLWHYTCKHSHTRLGTGTARLVPAWDLYDEKGRRNFPAEVLAVAKFVWLTDLDVPVADALGLTREVIGCDRTRFRYRVQDDRAWIARYVAVRRSLPELVRDGLETAPGAMPMHWWVAREAVSVVYDPIPVRARVVAS